jgi:hypothetical protein
MNLRRDEQAELRRVAARLKTDFPSVDPGVVDARVEAARDALSQAPIRNYVPILVERRARARITDRVTRATPPPPRIELRGHGSTACGARRR